MNIKSISIVVLSIILFSSCKEEKEVVTIKETSKYVDEPHSYAQPNNAVIIHLDLEINVDFDKEIISGSATYDIENNAATEIILDSKFLVIDKVLADGKETQFSLGDFDEMLGQALKIDIKESTKQITVFYKTTDKTEALQWLNPQQTADKKHPFLFTQGQAILTRTWIPIQDSPQIRITYDATVKVPSELMAVMSAENPKEKNTSGEYHFKMKQAISPYLIALAVGDIQYKEISNRTGVYAENSVIEKATTEFSDLEKMVTTAENLYGKYAWEQFDVIVLPPSFPFGGMENPRLTFATPTVIAGDKSLTSLLAHELAHSWSGNLVTNATWDDFWLNEGFTVYFEIRIMEVLYGVDRANMLALIGRQDLEDEIENLKETPNETKLKLDLKGHNPDDGMNSIAYDKGYLFLRTLEEAVGRDRFDFFLKNYFNEHAFSTITTERFIVYLKENLLDKNNISFNLDEWIYTPGIPENQSIIISDKFKEVENVIKKWNEGVMNAEEICGQDWNTQQRIHFIRNIPESISVEKMTSLDAHCEFTGSTNSYIQMVWFVQAINHNYHGQNIDLKIEEFLINVGRRWYVEDIFKAFKKNDRVDDALVIYKKSRANYHSVTASTIDLLLGYKE